MERRYVLLPLWEEKKQLPMRTFLASQEMENEIKIET